MLLLPRAPEVCARMHRGLNVNRKMFHDFQPVDRLHSSTRAVVSTGQPPDMEKTMSHEIKGTPPQAAADTQPNAMLTPDEVVEQIRALRARIPDVTPLTAEQRRLLRNQANLAAPVIQASINVIGASEVIAQGVGLPVADVRQLAEDANRWTAVEDELRTMLNGVAGGNLSRRQRLAVMASQAYAFGRQLARVPQNALLVPHVAEIKRLRKLASRKQRTSPAPETPSPAPVTPQAAETPES